MATDLSDPRAVKSLQANLRVCFGSDSGKEVIKFLEELCGWFDFKEEDVNRILIKTGKRQILATIKTLLELTPEQIVALKES